MHPEGDSAQPGAADCARMHDRAFVSWIGRWQQARTGGCSPQACPVASTMTPAKSVVRQVSQPVVGAQVITIRPMNTGCIRRSVGGRRGCLDCLRRCARGNPRVRQRRSGRLLSKRVSFACDLQPQVLSPLLRPRFADSIDTDGPAHLQQRCELVPQWTFAMAEEPEAVDRGRFRAGLLAIARCRAASSGLEDSIPDAKANLRMENHRRSVCDVVAWRLAAPRIRLVKLWRRCSVTPEPPRGRSDSAAAIPGRNAHMGSGVTRLLGLPNPASFRAGRNLLERHSVAVGSQAAAGVCGSFRVSRASTKRISRERLPLRPTARHSSNRLPNFRVQGGSNWSLVARTRIAR